MVPSHPPTFPWMPLLSANHLGMIPQVTGPNDDFNWDKPSVPHEKYIIIAFGATAA